jgi:Tol biopolymer transport system component
VDRITGAEQVSPTLMASIQELWVLDLEGNGTLLTRNAAMAADWSPDGGHIAYFYRPDPLQYDRYELWVATWPGIEAQRAVEQIRLGVSLWMSSDRLVFSDPSGLVKSIRPATRQIEDIVRGQEWTARAADIAVLSVSPDEQWIVVQAERLSDSKLALISLQDETWREIPSGPKDGFVYILGGLAWSPDSSRLAFSDDMSLHIVDLRLGREWEISTEGEIPHSLSWSPDGNMLLVGLRSSYQVMHVYAVNVDGSGWRDLSRDRNLGVLAPTWSPDGRYLFYSEYSYQDPVRRPRLMTVASR